MLHKRLFSKKPAPGLFSVQDGLRGGLRSWTDSRVAHGAWFFAVSRRKNMRGSTKKWMTALLAAGLLGGVIPEVQRISAETVFSYQDETSPLSISGANNFGRTCGVARKQRQAERANFLREYENRTKPSDYDPWKIDRFSFRRDQRQRRSGRRLDRYAE